MRRKLERLHRCWHFKPRLAATLLACLLLAASLATTVAASSLVTVTDDEGREHAMLLNNRTPSELLRLSGAVAGEHDRMTYSQADDDNSVDISIRRAFGVALVADGETYGAEVVDGTVADLLEACDVTLSGEDYVLPAAKTRLAEGLEVQVYRVSYEEEALERQELDDATATAFFEEKQAEDPSFTWRLSNRGLYDVTYEHRLVNGEVERSEITALNTLILPREPGSTSFEAGIPCSRIEGYDDVEMGPDGLPVNYTRKMGSAVCTAYSASRGRGSSGLGLYNGTCAVNPNVIPYGTRMYITSSDQSFVYGFCIATDTGGAMMEGRVDIDLFFETNAECLRFGKRSLDVYILD